MMTTHVGRVHENIKHVDIPNPLNNKKILTGVFYPIESDGNFVYYQDNKKYEIEPVMNRCIILDNAVFHHGNNPINHTKRIAINVNFVCE